MRGAAEMVRPDAAAFLRRLADPARPPIDGEGVCVVVAHPDDETIGCGAQLSRLTGVTVAIVTDGAPPDLLDARANDCDTAADYARLRDAEVRDALALAGVSKIIRFGIGDQAAARQLVELTRRLVALFSRENVWLALTHAYEGGHPDHDAVAFAVHSAAALLRRDGHEMAIVEMPLYYPTGAGWAVQKFVPDGQCPECVAVLAPDERALKERMIAAHASQRRTLAMFGTDAERFRRAPAHDFTAPPRDDALWYHSDAWGLTGEQWLVFARAAVRDLALETTSCH